MSSVPCGALEAAGPDRKAKSRQEQQQQGHPKRDKCSEGLGMGLQGDSQHPGPLGPTCCTAFIDPGPWDCSSALNTLACFSQFSFHHLLLVVRYTGHSGAHQQLWVL